MSVVISGIGQSAVGRRLGRDELDLTIEAALAAIADAGLTVADIDGLATYPGSVHRRLERLRGTGNPDRAGRAAPVAQLAQRRYRKVPAQIQAVINAVMAVSIGPGAARARVPNGHRVDRAGQRWPRRHRCRHHGHPRPVPVVAPLPRVLGGELAGDERAAPLPRVRHDPRADGADRAQRPRATRPAIRTRSSASRCRWTTTSRRA